MRPSSTERCYPSLPPDPSPPRFNHLTPLVGSVTDGRSELPYYCFPDGVPKPKKKGKRVQQTAQTESGAEGGIEEQGPSKRSKATPTEEAKHLSLGSSSTSAGQPSAPHPHAPDPAPAQNGSSVNGTEIAPPPGLENVPPLSAAAMASFASAAKGVTTVQEVQDEGGNREGLLVLNGAQA